MKKLFLGLLLSLISITSFACLIDSRGNCSGRAYFNSRNFPINSVFEFRKYGDTAIIQSFTTGNKINDSLFSVPSTDTIIKIQYRWKLINEADSKYTDWLGNGLSQLFYTSLNYEWFGCKTTPVVASNVNAQNNKGDINVSFNGGDETNVKEYNILASSDGRNYAKIGNSIAPTGAVKYSQSIDLRDIVAFLPFLLIGTSEEKNRKYSGRTKRWLTFLFLLGTIVLFSCKKESIKTASVNYSSVKIQTVNNDGTLSYSETQAIRN